MNLSYETLKAHIERCGCHEALGPVGDGWGIEQNPHELATFLVSLPERPKTVLEIGTGYRAGLARFFTEVLGSEVVTVGLFQPVTPAPQATQIIGKSLDVVDQVAGKYDLVIIDADHSYEAVRQDFLVYGHMGKVVLFHDIAGIRGCEGVQQFWQELSRPGHTTRRKGAKPPALSPGYHEVIDDGPQRAGIGWITDD